MAKEGALTPVDLCDPVRRYDEILRQLAIQPRRTVAARRHVAQHHAQKRAATQLPDAKHRRQVSPVAEETELLVAHRFVGVADHRPQTGGIERGRLSNDEVTASDHGRPPRRQA